MSKKKEMIKVSKLEMDQMKKKIKDLVEEQKVGKVSAKKRGQRGQEDQ